MIDQDRMARYRAAHRQLEVLLRGLEDPVAAMACVAAVLHHALPEASWVGFYRVVEPQLLRIGPYQGPVGCLEIPFGQGVCGAAASDRSVQIVPDVHAFPGHIACDPRAQSEIVIPVNDARGNLVAVLDLDSHQRATFTRRDGEELEGIVELLEPCFGAVDKRGGRAPAQLSPKRRTK